MMPTCSPELQRHINKVLRDDAVAKGKKALLNAVADQQTKRADQRSSADQPVSQTSAKGNLNMGTPTTTATAIPDFPLPHPLNTASDDVCHAMELLTCMTWTFDQAVTRGMTKDAASTLYTILCDVMADLRPVLRYLRALDDAMSGNEQYQAARREEIVKVARVLA